MERGRIRRISREERSGVNPEDTGGSYSNQQCSAQNSRSFQDTKFFQDTSPQDRGFKASESLGGCRSQHGQKSMEREFKAQQGKMMEFWSDLNNTRIAIRHGEKTVARIPASLGLAGVVGSLFSRKLRIVGALGLVGAVTTGYRIRLEHPEECANRSPSQHESNRSQSGRGAQYYNSQQSSMPPYQESPQYRYMRQSEPDSSYGYQECSSSTDESEPYHWEYPDNMDELGDTDRSSRRSRAARQQYCQ